MKKNTSTLKTIITSLSFLLVIISSLFWFYTTYWLFPKYRISVITYLEIGVSNWVWLLMHFLYIVAFFPLLIALFILFLEYTFLTFKFKVLKICISLVILFITSILIIFFLIFKSNIYVSTFNQNKWIQVPTLRYESVNNLLETHNLIDCTKNQVLILLGNYSYESQKFEKNICFWDLTNPLCENNQYLKITFFNNKVISIKIVQG